MLFSESLFLGLAPLLLAGTSYAVPLERSTSLAIRDSPPPVPQPNDCDHGPFSDALSGFGTYDYPGRKTQCATSWSSNEQVVGMEIWSTDWHVQGIQLTFSGNTTPAMFGSKTDTTGGQANADRHHQIFWKAGDQITKFAFCGNSGPGNNHHPDALGAIWLEVAGQKLEVGPQTSVGNFRPGYQEATNLGIMAGVKASVDANIKDAMIRSFTPLFIGGSSVKADQVSFTVDQTADDLNKKKDSIQSVNIGSSYITNDNPPASNQSLFWTFTGSTSRTNRTDHSSAHGDSGGITATVSTSFGLDIPGLKASVDTSLSGHWEHQQTNTDSWGKDSTFTVSWSAGATQTQDLIPPGKVMKCVATVLQGQYDVPYTAVNKLTYKGQSFFYTDVGTLRQTSWSDSYTNCQLIDRGDVPKGAAVVPGSTSAGKR